MHIRYFDLLVLSWCVGRQIYQMELTSIYYLCLPPKCCGMRRKFNQGDIWRSVAVVMHKPKKRETFGIVHSHCNIQVRMQFCSLAHPIDLNLWIGVEICKRKYIILLDTTLIARCRHWIGVMRHYSCFLVDYFFYES